MNFINEICNQYKQKEFNVNLTTTTPSLVGALTRDKKWLLKRFGRSVDNQNSRKKTNVRMLKSLTKSSSKKRITYSFNYKNKSIT